MDSDWILWGAVLIAWPSVGVAIAYVFNEITHGEEVSAAATLPPAKRSNAARRALTQPRTRRFFGGWHRH